MSESQSILSNIFKRGKHTSPSKNARYSNFRDSSSLSIFHDSGYNESLKDPSFECTDTEHKRTQNERGLPEYSKHSHSSFSTLVLSSTECENKSVFLSERKETSVHKDFYETPKVAKKDLSLRRRLLVSKAASFGAVGWSERQLSSSGISWKKPSHFLSFDERISKCSLDCPRKKTFKPLATSTLKNEDPAPGCQKLRLLFSQQRTSTIDDSKSKGSLSEPGCLSPIQPTASTNIPNGFFDRALTSFNDQSTCSEFFETPNCILSETNDDGFVTPISNLIEGFNTVEINTPPAKEIKNQSLLTPNCSNYNSLVLYQSEDSLSDREGSFQELIQKRNESSTILNSKRKVRKLQRSRRLSTLSERGSQSEKEEDYDTIPANSKCKLKIGAGSICEGSELVFNEDDGKHMAPKAGDMSRTPALQVIHELFRQCRNKRTEPNYILRNIYGDGMSMKHIVAQLIGKKMGLEKLDILTELRDRDLKHVLTVILDILTVESLCSMWKVSKSWQEIVIQDKHANRRRKLYLKQLRAEVKGCLPDAEDAATRFTVPRFALRPVQAQAKSTVLHMQSSCSELVTPIGCSPVLQSASKQEAYVQVAQTLFTDEALRPCPRCQSPAKYQPLKTRGLCSREDCAFDFCILCLCTFHGSKDCSSSSTKSHKRKEALPGSAKSKRNLKRL